MPHWSDDAKDKKRFRRKIREADCPSVKKNMKKIIQSHVLNYTSLSNKEPNRRRNILMETHTYLC